MLFVTRSIIKIIETILEKNLIKLSWTGKPKYLYDKPYLNKNISRLALVKKRVVALANERANLANNNIIKDHIQTNTTASNNVTSVMHDTNLNIANSVLEYNGGMASINNNS